MYKSIFALSLTLFLNFSCLNNKKCIVNKNDAKKFAIRQFKNAYGENVVNQKPFIVEFINNCWIVHGTAYKQKGGYPYIKINSKNCKIIKLIHTK
jgi:hypothetical protein